MRKMVIVRKDTAVEGDFSIMAGTSPQAGTLVSIGAGVGTWSPKAKYTLEFLADNFLKAGISSLESTAFQVISRRNILSGLGRKTAQNTE